jgi:hypothetical protein
MENRETIDENAQRWAALMRLCGLRGHVFAEGEAPEAKRPEGRPVSTPTKSKGRLPIAPEPGSTSGLSDSSRRTKDIFTPL